MASMVFVAVDIGASSGRHVAGKFDGHILELEELYRFANGPTPAAGQLYWDLLNQWHHVCRGLQAAAAAHGAALTSIGLDTWGVDFGLLGRGDELLGNPVHYRDRRTEGMLEVAHAVVPREQIFAQTGVQFMQINSLYQLLSMQRRQSPILEAAETLLMMPDLFNWLLTGVKGVEFTNATTTQFYNPTERRWAFELFDALDLPSRVLGPIVEPGSRLGKLRSAVAEELNLPNVEVVAPGTHDTASAVLAVPAATSGAAQSDDAARIAPAGGRVASNARPNWCYISSGTWSLMGVEMPRPVIGPQALALNFTNEGGIGGTIRLLKNIAGLWLVQECRRIWHVHGRDYRWSELAELAAGAPPLVSLLNPDAPEFLAPADMPAAIRAYCQRHGQAVPQSEGAVLRTAIESLALRYRQCLGWLEQLIGGRIETIHIVGGGAQHEQLCQATADACQRTVLAGPVEATAAGNLLMQAIAAGQIGSVAQAREVVRQSFAVRPYEPGPSGPWDEAFARFLTLVG